SPPTCPPFPYTTLFRSRGAQGLVLPRADTLIWLDPPLRVIFARLFLRALRRIRSGEELWPGTGNRETFRNQFLSRDTLFWWAIRSEEHTSELQSRVDLV